MSKDKPKGRAVPAAFKHLNWVPVETPKFKSEKEEAAWWDAHMGVAAAMFQRAAQAGLLTKGTIARSAETRQMTMRMPTDAIKRAKAVAQRKGLPYQTYLRTLIFEGLKRDEKVS